MPAKEGPHPILRRKSRATWRAWLRERHGTATEVWLVFYKKHTGKVWITYEEAVEEALCFGWIDGTLRRLDEDTYVHRFTPRKPRSNWSPTNRRRVERLVAARRMTSAGMAVVDAARADGSYDAQSAAEVSHEMPSELVRALGESPRATEGFDSLSPSQRRLYVSWIASAKRTETRARRAAKAVSLLEKGEKLGMV